MQQEKLNKIKKFKNIIFVDLETTGTNPEEDKIVQIGAIYYDDQGVRYELDELVNPEVDIPEAVSQVHGIREEDVADSFTFRELMKSTDFLQWLETSQAFVAYNALFDFQFLQNELSALGYDIDISEFAIIDPLKIFQKHFNHQLDNAYRYYCDKELIGGHSAIVDIKATEEVLSAQLNKYQEEYQGKTWQDIQGATYGERIVPGKWFKVDGKDFIFKMGKFRGQKASSEHLDYLKWMRNNVDLTRAEKDLIDDRFLTGYE